MWTPTPQATARNGKFPTAGAATTHVDNPCWEIDGSSRRVDSDVAIGFDDGSCSAVGNRVIVNHKYRIASIEVLVESWSITKTLCGVRDEPRDAAMCQRVAKPHTGR